MIDRRQRFISKATKKYGDKYTYEKVVYVDSYTPVTITCKIHGDFNQDPKNFLCGHGCPLCSKSVSYNTEILKEKLKTIYGNKYDFSKLEYKSLKSKIKIICPIHDEFEVITKNFIKGCGCPKCKIDDDRLNNKNKFIEKAKQVHNNKYDYSKVEYINNSTKVCIICPEHGEFWQTPSQHLVSGCSKCSGNYHLTNDEFIDCAKEIHNAYYNYSKCEYTNIDTPVNIICPEHGPFWQTPYNHLKGHKCPYCSHQSFKYTTEDYIKKAKLIHNNKYDYSKTTYINSSTKICIICTEHGEFWQSPHSHLSGHGCPTCQESLLEKKTQNFLIKNEINFIPQKTFDFLEKDKRFQYLDFYLPNYNIAIECQGIQHIEQVAYFGGEETFKITQERDTRKYNKCIANNITIFYLFDSNVKIDGLTEEIYLHNNVYNNIEKLIKDVKNFNNRVSIN